MATPNRAKDFDPSFSLVSVTRLAERRAVWKDPSKQSVKGDEFEYRVIDGNFKSRCRWEFRVRVPANMTPSSYIDVCPSVVPRESWALLDHRSIELRMTTAPAHAGKVFANLPIFDVAKNKPRKFLKEEHLDDLPKWLKSRKPMLKREVFETRGNDGNSLVVLFDPLEYEDMIRLYLGLKPWVLYKGYVPCGSRGLADLL